MLTAGVVERLGIGIASVVLAFVVGLCIVAAAGYSPLIFLNEMLLGALGSQRGIALTLRESSLYILTGVAVAVAFRAGIFNIGVQGQFIVGGLSATMAILRLAPFLPTGAVGGVALIVLGSLVGIAVGGAYAALPGALKAYADANEIITTIMLNFIALGVVLYLISGPFQGEGRQEPRTDSLPEYVEFPSLLFETGSFSVVGLVVALASVAVAYVLLTRTRMGYDMVTSGKQASAALYSGVRAERTIIGTMTFSGMVAGLTGAVFSIMVLGGYVDPQGIHTYGFDAIAVSLLAANNPLGVVPAGVLFGGLSRGGSFIGITTDIPAQLVDGVIGLVILFVAAPELFRMAARRTGLGSERR
ncbi:ABC transporter permease [Halobacteriales archaeon QS_4_62_28]|nr:MAG: ABC transporter permease [Halobacteriales archaeon QS_4_62_28]